MTHSNLEQRVERLERLVGALLDKENPWVRLAGIWKDDPQIDEFRAAVEEYRREVDQRDAVA